MKHKPVKAILSITLLLALLALATPAASPAHADVPAEAEVFLEPTPVEVMGAQPFAVTLHINNVPAPGMAAYDFKITYDEDVINFDTDVGAHDWHDPDYGTPFTFFVRNDLGEVNFNDIYTGVPAPSGDIMLVTLYGTAVASETATTVLHFEKADVKDPDGVDIPKTLTDGQVDVWFAPVASFTWEYSDDNASGTLDAGEEIQFTDASTNEPDGWDWDFDDGSSSAEQNPTHTYTMAGTHSVSLTASNLVDSDTYSEFIVVEPNSLDSVVVSPDPARVMVGGSVSFGAAGYDQYDNLIPLSNPTPDGIVWTWGVTDPTAGTIDEDTGEFTAGTTPGTYPDAVKATGTYKGVTESGYADVEVVTLLAETAIGKGLDADGRAEVNASIVRVSEPDTEGSTEVSGGIASYEAELTYDGSQVNILDVFGGDYPFDDVPTFNIDDGAGLTTFSAAQTEAEPQPPITVSYMSIRLVGSAEEDTVVELSFTEILDGNGHPIPEEYSTTMTFRRGDADADGTVDISDVLFICQYLVGLRDVGQETGQVHPINAASVKHDDPGDEITISDALFIAQYLAGQRDANFNLIGIAY